MKSADEVNQAAKILNQGGIIIFPTDTAFGIGCRIDKPLAVERLFKIRKRPLSQAVPVLVDSLSMAEKYWLSPLPNIVRQLINDYWPGGLTVVYPCNIQAVPSLVRGSKKTLGIRMPDHKKILKIIGKVKVPLLGPSANFHGDKTPYRIEDINRDLVQKADMLVTGVCSLKQAPIQSWQASTVIDVSREVWQILRQGKIKIDLDKYGQ